MAASGARIYETAYMVAIGRNPVTVDTPDGPMCGQGLDIDEVRELFYRRGWNPDYNHHAWQNALKAWEDYDQIVRVGRVVFFKPRLCHRTSCAAKIEKAMSPEATAVI